MLSIKDYYKAQKEAKSSIFSSLLLSAAVPVTFNKFNFEADVSENRELVRYLNSMHCNRTAHYLESYKLYRDELDLFRPMYKKLRSFCAEYYGVDQLAIPPLLAALYEFRFLKEVLPPGGTVLEIGAGAGLLISLLASHGYRCIVTDITPAFYVLQNHIFHLFAKDVIELCTDSRALRDFTSLESGTVLHAPWYKYMVVDPCLRIDLDAVAANNMLAEMHPSSLKYSFALWKILLSGKDRPQLLFANGTGANTPETRKLVDEVRYEKRFAIAFGPSYTVGFVNMDNVAYQEYLDKHGSKSSTVFSSDNMYQRKVDAMLARNKDKPTVSYDELVAVIMDELGYKDFKTDDERFTEFLES